MFFSLLLLFLPTQLGFHFWPDWAMVLGRRIDYLSPTIYLTDAIVFIVLLFWFIESRPKFRFQILFPVLLFATINIWVSKNQPEAIYKWLKVLEFVLLGWYIVKTKPSFSFITSFLSVGVLYSSLIAIGQFFLQHSIRGPLWFLGERAFTVDTPGIARIAIGGREFLRAYGTFPHPNVLGGYIAALLPLVIISARQLSKKIFYAATIILGAIALVLTFSRSAWVVGLFGIVYGTWKSTMSRTSNFFLLVPCLLIIILFITQLQRLPFTDESVVVRQQLNNAAFSMWQHSPLVGVGLGNFLVELPKALPSKSVYFLQPVHNIYLLVLAETGVVSFILFCWFLWKVFLHPFSIYHLSFIILLILGLVDHYPLSLQQGQLLFTLLLALTFVNH